MSDFVNWLRKLFFCEGDNAVIGITKLRETNVFIEDARSKRYKNPSDTKTLDILKNEIY